MHRVLRFVALVCIVMAAALASGCATVVKGSKQNIAVQTDPEGASCELAREGQVIGVVSPTPGNLEVEKDKDPIDVTCKKQGFEDAKDFMSSSFQEWTLGNILIGGVIGIAIDAGSGAAMQYPPGINLKLTPDKFATAEERTDFYDKWRSDVLQNSTKAKIEASKTCSKEQCDEVVKRIDRETEQALASIETQRNFYKGAPAATSPVTQAAPQASASGPDTVQAAPSTGQWHPKKGDRWQYRMVDGKRAVGTVNIEVLDSGATSVNERITRDGSPGFVLQREVQPEFRTTGFLPSVQLPGGYKLVEFSAFFPPDATLQPGKSFGQISGDLDILTVGKRTLVWDTRVINQERVRVPAGDFEAWKIEARSSVVTNHGPLGITYFAWYSPSARRAVKISLNFHSRIDIGSSSETLELASFANAQ